MREVVELTTESEWREAHPVITALYPELLEEEFVTSLRTIVPQGYKLFALRDFGKIVSVVGIQPMHLLVVGKIIWIFDMATDLTVQSKGYGTELLNFVEEYAKQNGYTRVLLHAPIQRDNAIRFYESNMGEASGLVFRKVINL